MSYVVNAIITLSTYFAHFRFRLRTIRVLFVVTTWCFLFVVVSFRLDEERNVLTLFWWTEKSLTRTLFGERNSTLFPSPRDDCARFPVSFSLRLSRRPNRESHAVHAIQKHFRFYFILFFFGERKANIGRRFDCHSIRFRICTRTENKEKKKKWIKWSAPHQQSKFSRVPILPVER